MLTRTQGGVRGITARATKNNDDAQGSLFVSLPVGTIVRQPSMLPGARTLKRGDDIVVKGYAQYISCIREVLKEWKGNPGIYYKVIRFDPDLKCAVPTIVSWMDVVFYRVSPNRKQDSNQRKDQRDGHAGGKKPKGKSKRRDVTDEINDMFSAIENS